MQRLRQASFLARLVLAWFALAIGAAMASPVVRGEALQVVCSGGAGLQLLPADPDEAPAGRLLPDCPLCMVVAPPVAAAAPAVPAAAATPFLRPSPAVPGAWIQAPPARGPPA